jgi:hypothetical protein
MPKRRNVTIPECSEPGIYAIQDHKGNRYVGSSLNVGKRWATHVNDLQAGIHHNYRLQAAWDAFGGDKFTFTLLEACGPRDLTVREQKWMDDLNPHYNIQREAARPDMQQSRDRIMRYRLERDIAQCRKYYRDLAACERLARAMRFADGFTTAAILFDADHPHIGGEVVRRGFHALYERARCGKWPWGNDDERDYYQWFTIASLAETGWFEILSRAYLSWAHNGVQSLAAMSDEDISQQAILKDRRLEYRSREMDRAS